MIVVDASAVVDLLVGTPRAPAVERRLAADDAWLAPELLVVEVVSALARLVRAGVLSSERAHRMSATIASMPVRLVEHRPLIADVWERRAVVRVADAFYVATAAAAGVPLVTTDARLARSVPSDVSVEVVGE